MKAKLKKEIKARVAKNFLELNIKIFINREEAAKNPKRTYRLLINELEEEAREAVYDPEKVKQKVTIYLGTRGPREIKDLLKIKR